MSLIVKDKQLFKNYNKIWEKIEGLMKKKKIDSKPFYANDNNSKYIKTKRKNIFTKKHYYKFS